MGNEASRLQSAIRALESIVERDGPTRFAMTSLARLHALRAVALAASGEYSEALVEIAMAIDHDAEDEQIQRTRRQLAYQMEVMQREAATIGRIDPRVNPDDLALVSEARRGFEPMKQYQSSKQAVETRALVRSLIVTH